jgi:hypothetical protein
MAGTEPWRYSMFLLDGIEGFLINGSDIDSVRLEMRDPLFSASAGRRFVNSKAMCGWVRADSHQRGEPYQYRGGDLPHQVLLFG